MEQMRLAHLVLFQRFGPEAIDASLISRESVWELKSCRCLITFTPHWTSVTLGSHFTPGGRRELPTS